MGICYLDLGKYNDALTLFEAALETFKENFGEMHEEIANTYNNIAKYYHLI